MEVDDEFIEGDPCFEKLVQFSPEWIAKNVDPKPTIADELKPACVATGFDYELQETTYDTENYYDKDVVLKTLATKNKAISDLNAEVNALKSRNTRLEEYIDKLLKFIKQLKNVQVQAEHSIRCMTDAINSINIDDPTKSYVDVVIKNK